MTKNAANVPREVDDASESPFEVPPVSSGYPLEHREEKAIDRVIEDGARQREEAAGDQEAA